MTDDQLQSMRADIAFMKELAEDGQQPSARVGGAILAAAGAVYAVAAGVQWGLLTGRLPFAPNASLVLWAGATVLFLVLVFAAKAVWGRGGPRGPGSRANASVWIGAGLGIGALVVAFFIAANRTGQWGLLNLIAPSVLALYGAAWFVNAAVTRRRLFTAIAVGCFITAALMGFLADSANLLLAYAAALVLFALLPGLLLMRREPQAS